jgi:hypothetical protein
MDVELEKAMQTVRCSGPYASEEQLKVIIQEVLTSLGWTLKCSEWCLEGFPELGSGDLVFARAGSNDLVVEVKLVAGKPTSAARQRELKHQAVYYGRLWVGTVQTPL